MIKYVYKVSFSSLFTYLFEVHNPLNIKLNNFIGRMQSIAIKFTFIFKYDIEIYSDFRLDILISKPDLFHLYI